MAAPTYILELIDRGAWNESVSRDVAALVEQHPGCRITLLAGKAYAGWIHPHQRVGQPLQGLEIGQRLQWFKRQAAH